MNGFKYKEIVSRLHLLLPDYLQDMGINSSKSFRCLNPEHEDKHPSMRMLPTRDAVYCHSCKVHGTIFWIAHIKEGLPLTGKGFITKTIPELAKRYGLEDKVPKLTEADTQKYEAYRIIKAIDRIIVKELWENDNLKDIREYAISRGWDQETCNQLRIGAFLSPDMLSQQLLNMGYDPLFLGKLALFTPKVKDVFNRRLVFVLQNDQGDPVGFAGRSINNTKPKYINSSNLEYPLNIYTKKKFLYGINRYLSLRKSADEPLIIVEGYADVITLNKEGVNNVAAICGSSLTDNHISELIRLGVRKVILAIDGDQKGKDLAKNEQIKNAYVLVKAVTLDSMIKEMPDDKDPDNVINELGIEGWNKLPEIEVFEWLISKQKDNPVIAGQKFASVLALDTSPIRREARISALVKSTGITKQAIQAEIKKIEKESDTQLKSEQLDIIHEVVRRLNTSPSNAIQVMQEAASNLLEVEHGANFINITNNGLTKISDIKKKGEINSKKSYKLGNLDEFNKFAVTDWSENTLLLLSGKPNHGKTTLLCQLAIELVYLNENAMVIYHTVDDSRDDIVKKMVTFLAQKEANQKGIKILQTDIEHPDMNNSEMLVVRNNAFGHLSEVIANDKLIILDSDDSTRLTHLNTVVDYMLEMYPDRQAFIIIDYLHMFSDFSGAKDTRNRLDNMATYLKQQLIGHRKSAIVAVELRKVSPLDRPTNEAIKETSKLPTVAHVILHMYNELSDASEVGKEQFSSLITSDGTCPIIEVNVSKNKRGHKKGRFFLTFDSKLCKFVLFPEKEGLALAEESRQTFAKLRNQQKGYKN